MPITLPLSAQLASARERASDGCRWSEGSPRPLAGIRVLDFTQVVAGPCTGRILVEYGADVVKINQAHPESLAGAVLPEPDGPRTPATSSTST